MKASKVRTLIIEDFNNAFSEVDAIITPVSPEVSWKI
jgi:Asp-tRNA(Asn)/Glu-tRNA(Gln) amidotransferase A subunit family amidase